MSKKHTMTQIQTIMVMTVVMVVLFLGYGPNYN